MTTFFIRELYLSTHTHCMGDWFETTVMTVGAKPVFHAVEQRYGQPNRSGFREHYGVLILSDIATGEQPMTHAQKLIFVKSREGMAQSWTGRQKYLGSFVCESGFRWYVFRALPEDARRAVDGTQPSRGAPPEGSSQVAGSTKPSARSQSNGSSQPKPAGTQPGPRT